MPVFTNEELDDCLFSAKVEDVGTVASLLKSVAFCEKVNVFINTNGLKFTVEEGKYVQASILIQKELFEEFTMKDEETYFKIPLKELLEFLKIFCSDGKSNTDLTVDNLLNTSLKLMYRRPGSAFEISLDESGVVTDFQLKTDEIDDLMEFDIDPADYKISMKADLFFDLLAEIDNNSPETIEIRMVPNQHMVISARGVSGLMEVIVPANSEIVDFFDCTDQPCTARYRLAIVKYAFKALQIGQKVVLKMNTQGILCLSFLLSTKADSFVEFFCIPLQGEEDETVT